MTKFTQFRFPIIARVTSNSRQWCNTLVYGVG